MPQSVSCKQTSVKICRLSTMAESFLKGLLYASLKFLNFQKQDYLVILAKTHEDVSGS